MLDRAVERIKPQTTGTLRTLQGDMRELDLGEKGFDIIVTASTLHHLRTDDQWEAMYHKMFTALRPRGSLWVFDMIEHDHPALEKMMRARYGDYLYHLKGGGEAGTVYREKVFAYIAEEDTPRSLGYQLALLQKSGFSNIEVLHKSVMGAAFGGFRT